MNKKLLFCAPYTIIAILCSALGWWLSRAHAPLLYMLQEMNLYLPTEAYRESMMRIPGGALFMASSWCTDWFFNPWMGICLLVVIWIAIGKGLKLLYRLDLRSCLLAVVPAIALYTFISEMGYWLYYIKTPGYAFVPSLGTLVAVWTALGVRYLPGNNWLRTVVLLFISITLYPLAGAWGLLAVVLSAVASIESRKDLWGVASALMLVLVTPLAFYRLMYSETMLQHAWSAALPSFRYADTMYREYYLPYLVLVPSLFVPLLTKIPVLNKRKYATLLFSLLVVAAAMYVAHKQEFKDKNFDKEIMMQKAVWERNFERVISIYREKSDVPPTRIMVMMKNLAMLHVGRAGDEMFLYPDGGEPQHSPLPVKITQLGGKLIYYEVGKTNFCYRWSMEDAVEFGWKVNYMKLMAKSALLNHDWEVARKYLRLLSMTRFHKEWAEHYMQFVGNAEKVQQDEELGFIRRIMPGTDNIDGDNTIIELYLLKVFANGMGADKTYAELALMCSMILRDINLFWPRFFRYAELMGDQKMPRYYQEAAYLYGILEPQTVDTSGMPFDDSVKERYARFMQFNQQCGNMSEEQKAIAFKPLFGDTFFYYYFLVKNVKTN